MNKNEVGDKVIEDVKLMEALEMGEKNETQEEVEVCSQRPIGIEPIQHVFLLAHTHRTCVPLSVWCCLLYHIIGSGYHIILRNFGNPVACGKHLIATSNKKIQSVISLSTGVRLFLACLLALCCWVNSSETAVATTDTTTTSGPLQCRKYILCVRTVTGDLEANVGWCSTRSKL